jgi:DNA-directed RNA polymerase subunit RPC12/RpoP
MEEDDKIIVLKSFYTSVEASLAKSKLDAHGIPCFLTEENLANLYPVHNPRFSGVRLHLFLKDFEYARQILAETILLTDEELTRCPRCRSTRVELDYTKKLSSRLLSIVFTFFFLIFPLKKVYRCQDCEHEFNG